MVGPQGDGIVRLGHSPPLPTLEMANPVIGLYHQAEVFPHPLIYYTTRGAHWKELSSLMIRLDT